MRKAVVMGLLMLVVTGCATHRVSSYTIEDREVFVGWTEQSRLPQDAYYVLVEGDPSGKTWSVREVYDHPIKGRDNELQEVLFIDKAFRFVQPYFEVAPSTIVTYGEETKGTLVGHTTRSGDVVVTGMDLETKKQHMDRGSWECGALIQGDKNRYTPCTSRLTKTDLGKSVGKNLFAVALTAGLASGTHQVVDKEKVVEVVKSAKVFQAIKNRMAFSQGGER